MSENEKGTKRKVLDGINTATQFLGPVGALVGGITKIAGSIPKPQKWKRRARAAESLLHTLLRGEFIKADARDAVKILLMEANALTRKKSRRYDLEGL